MNTDGFRSATATHNPKVAGSNPAPATEKPRSAHVAGLGFFADGGVPPGGTGRRFQDCGESAGGFLLHAGEDVLVGRHREGGCRVAESFADDLDGNAGFEKQRGVGVAEGRGA